MQTFTEYLTENYPQYHFLLQKLSNILGEQPEWHHFTKTNLIKIRKGLQQELSANSVRTYMSVLKAIFNQVSDEDVVPCQDYNSTLNVKKEASTAVYLTEKETERLLKVRYKNATEEYVLCLYGIQSFTGCRVSDAHKLGLSNMQGDRISYVSEKSKTEASIPLSPKVREMVERLERLEPVTEATYRSKIKELCNRAGITQEVKIFKGGKDIVAPKYKLVSTHAARRSFATNLYLRGLDLYSISKLMGHASTNMTEKYICCGLRDIDKSIMSFFG